MSDELVAQAAEPLRKLQAYDLQTLARTDLPGIEFGLVVAPAQRMLALFHLIPVSGLEDLPRDHLNAVKGQAVSALARFDEIANFSISAFNGNLPQWRDDRLNNLREMYHGMATHLTPVIGFLTAKRTDFRAIETEARSTLHSISEERAELLKSLESAKGEAEAIKDAMKKAAAEVGVTQEAIHFQNQAKEHEEAAQRWLIASIVTATILTAYSVASIFLTRWDFLAPRDNYETVQLAVSKVLVFAVIAFMVVTCVRNFSAHRHNAVVNRHRQHALQTFKALASAAHVKEAQDIVLTHAAACIYAPQETAYAKASGNTQPNSVIEMLPRFATGTPSVGG